MAKSKKTDLICIIVTVITLSLTILFMNGSSLGIQVLADAEETVEDNGHFSNNDMKTEVDTEGATTITLSENSAEISGNGAYFANGKLTIAYKGTYIISGSLSGQIVIDSDGDDKIWLILNGVDVNCSDNAALYVSQAEKVFLNLADGSRNSFTSGSKYSASAEKDGVDGAIYSKDDLTISGTGSLTVNTEYAHGIVCNDTLKVTGGSLVINAAEDGIHANDAVYVSQADIVIKATNDGITVSNSENEGEFYISSGKIDISGAYEGIEAVRISVDGGEISISSSDDGFNATGTGTGSGLTINDGVIDIINSGGRDSDGFDSNMDITINGGTIFVSNPSDGNAIDAGSESGGKVVINGGNIIACGGNMMAEAPDESGSQCSFMYSVTGNAGDTITLTAADGTELFTKTIPNSFSVVTVSMPELKQGETYTLKNGDQSYEIELTSVSTSNVSGGSGRGGGGFGGGAGGRGNRMQNFGENSGFTPPSMPQGNN